MLVLNTIYIYIDISMWRVKYNLYCMPQELNRTMNILQYKLNLF